MGLKREGMPSDAYISDFVSQFAEWGWDDLSSALALQVLASVRNSDWDEWLGHADSAPVETTAQDLGNDRIEGLVILDANTGDTLLDVTGVELTDGSQYVGLQDTDVEALRELGLELIFIHNHPNGTEASYDDLKSAFDAGAKLLIVITPQGQEYVYIRGRYGMVEVRDEKASYEVSPATLRETRELVARSKAQARAFEDDSPELIFRQGEPGFKVKLIQFARTLGSDSDLETLTELEILQEVLNNPELSDFVDPYAEDYYERKEYVTILKRASYIRKTAEVTGVEPALLAMVQLWEDYGMHNNPPASLGEHGSYTFVYAANLFPPRHFFRTFFGGREKSFGLAQIQIPNAINMLNRYPDWFKDLDLPVDDMQNVWGGYELQDGWSNYDVGYQLYMNEAFNIRVAGVLIARLQSEVRNLLKGVGVEPYISPHEQLMLATGAYNQGMNQLKTGLSKRAQKSIANVIEGVGKTVDIDYVHRVLSMEDEALERYGLFYGGYQDEG